MGNTSSVPTDPSCSLYLRRPERFAVKSMEVYAPRDGRGSMVSPPGGEINVGLKPVLQVDSSLNAVMKDDRPAEFIKDPDNQGSFPFVLKVPYRQTLLFKFKLQLQPGQSRMNNVTFISANSKRQLDNFITTEFFHNPNIQNEENVVLLGDYDCEESMELEFVWEYYASNNTNNPKGTSLVLCFAEYDKRDHTLQQLSRFSLYVEPAPCPETPTISSSSGGGVGGLGSNMPQIPIVPSPSPPPPIAYQSTNTNTQLHSSNNVAQPVPIPSTTTSAGMGSSPKRQGSQPYIPSSPLINNNEYEESIDVVLQREKQGAAVPRPDGDSTSQPEDGPLFRATIASLEKRTGNLKMKTKKLLKRSMLVHERQQGLVEAYRLFNQALREVAESDIPSFQPILYKYFDREKHGQVDLVMFLRDCSHDMHMHVIEPLRKLYELDIKSFDVRKREFDDESSQYYSWLSRYLSMKQEAKGKKKVEGDSKYIEKKKAFELCRFDYYSYMQDLHGGRKQQDVTFQLALYAESEMNRLISASDFLKNDVKPVLDSTVMEVKEANKDWSRQRTEREVRRRALERAIVAPDLQSPVAEKVPYLHDPNNTSGSPPPPGSSHTGDNGFGGHHPTSASAPPPLNFQGLKVNTDYSQYSSTSLATPELMSSTPDDDLITPRAANQTFQLPQAEQPSQPQQSQSQSQSQPQSQSQSQAQAQPQPQQQSQPQYALPVDDGLKKEGLLWAMSRPGGLSEPIANLNKAGWHKFWVVLAGGKICEYTNWKQGVVDLHNEPINLKVAHVREARNADRRFCFEVVTPQYKRVYQATNEEDMQAWIRAINNGITSTLENYPGSEEPVMSPAVQRRVSSKRTPSLKQHHYPKIPSPQHYPPSQQPQSTDDVLLHKVRALSPSNSQCADCNSSNKCEWMSINLLVVLCIDCSGVHRSLGSHISKVRSLTLDTVSFTASMVELIKSVNNGMMNSIWEKHLEHKPQVTSENRSSFVTEKYVEKKFIEPIARPNAHLRAAVQNSDLFEAMHALASRANPNTLNNNATDENSSKSDNDGESLLLYSLRLAGPDAKTFAMAELLLLNSAKLPTTVPVSLNGNSARLYLSQKISKDSGGGGGTASGSERTEPREKTSAAASMKKRISMSGHRSASISNGSSASK